MAFAEGVEIAKLIGNYHCTDDDDMALHMIFSFLVCDPKPFTAECVIANLFRLLIEGWEPARTYLVMMTGTRVTDEEEGNDEPVFFIDPFTLNLIELSTSTVLEVCDTLGGPLADLQFGEDEEDDEDDDLDDEDDDVTKIIQKHTKFNKKIYFWF